MAIIDHSDWGLSEKGRKDADRHRQKIDKAIRENVRDAIADSSIITRKDGKIIRIPVKVYVTIGLSMVVVKVVVVLVRDRPSLMKYLAKDLENKMVKDHLEVSQELITWKLKLILIIFLRSCLKI